ncbi:MAG: tetratricopeptide repeat protein [Bacteroidota bacterium]
MIVLPSSILTSQTKAAAPRPLYPSSLIRESDITSQVLEGFVLMQKANAGDAVAQHELGFRFLEGRGFPVDTVKASYWIAKAADQGLPVANFNLGLLYHHGWGVPWNPFIAYRRFEQAAAKNTPEALHILGLLVTENLIVPRDWARGYQLIKKAADLGLAQAKESLAEFERRGLGKSGPTEQDPKDKSSQNRNKALARDTTLALVFLNFQGDTSTEIGDSTLAKEALRELPAAVKPSVDLATIDEPGASDTLWMQSIAEAAAIGSPEALVMIGRCFEKGIIVSKDVLLAAEYYIRAIRLDSPRAPHLLWNLLHKPEFEQQLHSQADGDKPDALYVWACVTALGFDKLLSEQQAIQLLNSAVARNHIPSMMELALCYSSGRWVKQDKSRAMELWNRAAEQGSLEAEIKIATANILGEHTGRELSTSVAVLKNAALAGSLEAQTGFAYCYEKGIGVSESKGTAVMMYRRSAQRGSQAAYLALRRMHDELRPPDKEFQISD